MSERIISDLVLADLRHIEDAERGLLASIGCPADLLQLKDIIDGKAKAKPAWPARRQKALRRRAFHAFAALAFAGQARRHLESGDLAGTQAGAHFALLAGLHAGDLLLRTTQQRAGRASGRAISADAAESAKRTRKLRKAWNESEDYLQDQYPTPTSYVRKSRPISTRTIQRHLRSPKK